MIKWYRSIEGYQKNDLVHYNELFNQGTNTELEYKIASENCLEKYTLINSKNNNLTFAFVVENNEIFYDNDYDNDCVKYATILYDDSETFGYNIGYTERIPTFQEVKKQVAHLYKVALEEVIDKAIKGELINLNKE